MFNVKSRKLVLTLFCSLALVLVLTDHASANAQLDSHRMLRKRSPEVFARDSLSDVIDVGTQQDGQNPSQGSGPAGPVSSVSNPSSSLSSSSSLSHSPSPSSSIPLTSLSLSSSSSLSVSSSSSSSSSPSSSSSTQPPPTQTQQNDVPSFTPTSSKSQGQRTEVLTITSSDAGPTSAVPASSGASSTTRTTLTVIIALAATIGGVAIIWTVIRKWKFKPSDKFEDRMQPIDWQPTSPEEIVVPGLHRAASTHSHNSFYSSGHESDHNSSQHASNIHRGPTPPEHDFTAGPAHLAPGAGYADLARGSSPQPQVTQMHQAQYGVPLHHQGAYDPEGNVNGPRY